MTNKENDNRITFTINGMYDNHDGIEISWRCLVFWYC